MHEATAGPCTDAALLDVAWISLLQVMIAVMMQHWGNAGLDKHLKGIQGQYRRRAGLMHKAAQKVLAHQAVLADDFAAPSSV